MKRNLYCRLIASILILNFMNSCESKKKLKISQNNNYILSDKRQSARLSINDNNRYHYYTEIPAGLGLIDILSHEGNWTMSNDTFVLNSDKSPVNQGIIKLEESGNIAKGNYIVVENIDIEDFYSYRYKVLINGEIQRDYVKGDTIKMGDEPVKSILIREGSITDYPILNTKNQSIGFYKVIIIKENPTDGEFFPKGSYFIEEKFVKVDGGLLNLLDSSFYYQR